RIDSISERANATADVNRCGSVEHYCCAGSFGTATIQNFFDDPRVLGWLTAGQVVLRHLFESVLVGMDRPAIGRAVTDLKGGRRAKWRDFVQTWLAVDHQRVNGAESGERAGENWRALQIGDSDHLTPGSGRVGQRPHDIQHRRNRELAPNRADV